jgi:hypothetical protein
MARGCAAGSGYPETWSLAVTEIRPMANALLLTLPVGKTSIGVPADKPAGALCLSAV